MSVKRASTNATHKGPQKHGKPIRVPIAFALLLSVAAITAGCGDGGGTSSSSGGGSNLPSPSNALKADAGGVCETLLHGEAYTSTPPTQAVVPFWH